MTGQQKTEQMDKKPSNALFFVILALYLIANIIVVASSQTGAAVTIMNSPVPVAAFTGVFSSLANICLIFLVVYCDKRGFIASLVLICAQFPLILRNIIMWHNPSNIPGIFGNAFTLIAVIMLYRRTKQISKYQEIEVANLKEQQKLSQNLFEQTARALVSAIDAKDTYSHGHSLRVAEYSKKIAQILGKSEEECYRIYYAALLHDVGKIGVDESIINKKGKLSKEEYESIKKHSDMGDQILTSINEYPYLSIGAHFHHERYDGKGYPKGLKGEDIPEIARIISVADAYDAMTSNRSYRDAKPQDLVREEIVKGAGTQFDPEFAKIMLQLIDLDGDYEMKEQNAVKELAGTNELICGERRSAISDGIIIRNYLTGIHLKVRPEEGAGDEAGVPSVILFDALDGRYHDDEQTINDLMYYEYCEIWLDGRTQNSGVRKIETNVISGDEEKNTGVSKTHEYDIEAVRCGDHVLVKIYDGSKTTEITVALPDSTRYAYIGLTGEHCRISDVNIEREDLPVPGDYITRIADEVSYVDASRKGNIPNVQVNGPRTAATIGIPVANGLSISFHSMSLPTARLIWHCPYIVIYSSDDERVFGENYREFALIRFDGENCENSDFAANRMILNKNDSFEGWDAWKEGNRAGIDCTVSFQRKSNQIILTTENLGLSVRNITTINDGTGNIYAAITGDQCAITNIQVDYPN